MAALVLRQVRVSSRSISMADIPFFPEKNPAKDDKLTFVLIFVPCFALVFIVALLG
jgi:hypothetical protein